jgi:hypothetical protein
MKLLFPADVEAWADAVDAVVFEVLADVEALHLHPVALAALEDAVALPAFLAWRVFCAFFYACALKMLRFLQP